MSVSLYVAAKIGEALGIGLPGILLPVLLRRRLWPSVIGGSIGLAILPLIAAHGGYIRGSDLDRAIVVTLAVLWGAVLGAIIHFCSRALRRSTP